MGDRALMDYVLLQQRKQGRLLDVNVHIGESGGMSVHFLTKSDMLMEEYLEDGGCE